MAVIIRGNANKDVWNEWSDQLEAAILDADANRNNDDELVKALANVKGSKRFAEKATTIESLGDFLAKTEGADAAEDTFEEGYDSLIQHISFSKTVILSRELADDGNVDMMKARATNMVKAYKRSRAKYLTQLLTTSVGSTTTMSWGTQTGISIAAPDGQAIFNAAHPLKAVSGVTECNLYSNGFGTTDDVLNELANKMRNFRDDKGNVLGLLADTVVIPGNAPALEKAVKAVIGSDGEIGTNNNDINTQRGKWKLVVDYLWTPTFSTNAPFIIMSSEANKDLLGTMFYDRVALDIAQEVKTESRNLVYNGYSRWSAGTNNWRHLIMGGSADASAQSL